MNLSCKYDNLLLDLIEVSNVVNDSLVPDDMKNIIIEMSDDGVVLIGATPVLTFKKPLVAGSFTLNLDGEQLNDAGKKYIQIKSKELLDFLGSYKNLKVTCVEDVIFELNERGKIKCTVIEKVLEKKTESEQIGFLGDEAVPSGEPKTFSSQWIFENIPIKPNVMPLLTMAVPSDVEMDEIQLSNLSIHTKELLPIIQSGTSMYSYIMFDKHHAFAFHSAFTTFMINKTEKETNVFSGLKLSYRVAVFIDKIINSCNDTTVSVAKDNNYVYIKTSESESYIRYDNKLVEYKAYIDMFKKDNCILLNRFYLRDVLKRLSLVNDGIEFSIDIEGDKVTLRNSKFSQDIDIVNKKGFEGRNKVTFKIMPDVLNKAIICDGVSEAALAAGDLSKENVYIYCSDYNNNTVIIFSDANEAFAGEGENAWFSVVRVKTY